MAIKEDSDLLSVQLYINGSATEYASIIKIRIEKGVNKISKANIVLQDGDDTLKGFVLSDSSEYLPGNEIEVKAGYKGHVKTLFKGIITSQVVSFDSQNGPSLLIECMDCAVYTTLGRKNAYYSNCTDSEIMNKIVSSYTLSGYVEATEPESKHEKIIQFGTTDWDFIRSRADINGLVIVTEDCKISLVKPAISTSPVATLKYGENILDLTIAVKSDNQLMNVEAISWDASNQAILKRKPEESALNKEGNITGKSLAEVLDANELLQSPHKLEKDALDAWANAELLKSRLSRFQGTILCNGNSEIKPNTLVKIDGVGERINGDCYVSAITHKLKDGLWFTEIKVGLQNLEGASVNALKDTGRIPAINGLQIGKVKKIDNDPAGDFRVQVTLPLIQSSEDGVWARLSTLYASNGFGNLFYPEIGDEVILGFLDDNPSAPIILGSVYSKANAPKIIPDKKNTHKAIVTRTLLSIGFDEENKAITIETPGKNKIILSDKDKGITLTDQNNNKVQLNELGILIESQKDIIIKAAHNISFSGENIDVKAIKTIDMSSSNMTSKASMAYQAEGGASAELKSSGNVTVKGAMVSIN